MNEEEYSGWRFEVYRTVRAKLLHVKQTMSTEQAREVDKYVNAFLHGDVITVVSNLEAYDASVGVALSNSVDKQPLCKMIKEKIKKGRPKK